MNITQDRVRIGQQLFISVKMQGQKNKEEAQGKENNVEVSVVIVGYNEEKKIKESLEAVQLFFKQNKICYEIIFVDDGSTDKSQSIVAEFSQKEPRIIIISNKKNHGKGYVVRQGLAAAKGEFIVVTDADLAYPPDQISAFLSVCKENDIVVGTRIHKNAMYIMNYKSFKLLLLRHLISRFFNKLVQFLFGIRATDTQCGLKVFRRDIAKKIAALTKINGFSYDVEMFIIAKKKGAKITEFPVKVIHSYADSKVMIFKHSRQMFLEVLQIKWYELTGVYEK